MRVEYNPSVVVPNDLSDAGRNRIPHSAVSAGGNVHQSVYAEDQLRGLHRERDHGRVAARNSRVDFQGPDWPASDTAVNRFDITLSTLPVAPERDVGHVCEQYRGGRDPESGSGPMTIPAKAFPYARNQRRLRAITTGSSSSRSRLCTRAGRSA